LGQNIQQLYHPNYQGQINFGFNQQNMANKQPPIMNDDILEMLQEWELKINSQRKSNIYYHSSINETINLMVPIKQFPYKFDVPHMDKFNGNEDTREHLQ